MKKIMFVFGTRPEAIKLAPLIKELQKYPSEFSVTICVTGQHREMLDQVLKLFEIIPNYDMNIMKQNQSLYDITSNTLMGMRDIFKKNKPDLVLVQGDTTTSMISALSSFYEHIKVGHIEAGLRTNNIYSPWPEEMNRIIISRIASYHFAPTEFNKQNLINEGIDSDGLYITGNTVIDALFMVVNKFKNNSNMNCQLVNKLKKCGYDINRIKNGRKLILITAHRRENFGKGFLDICNAIKSLTIKYPEVDFVYPMHLNPNVRNPIIEIFGRDSIPNIFFIEPLEYLEFIYMMKKSYIILTDSGGVQEEAPSLGKPVIVMRDTTERQEALNTGTVKLVGTDYNKIINEVTILLSDQAYYKNISKKMNPYGDGHASKRIVNILKKISF
ncbi:MAG: UDP-N-acetylglucosamine 2-epimerase (non-hydrolyzing) [Candidatus Cloacimonetes bacterium]|nr:UDP-N-acetylglucosamine 2-epimerase (non-hydrolyzing) [Candidatus Cloacimonadota bacterium]